MLKIRQQVYEHASRFIAAHIRKNGIPHNEHDVLRVVDDAYRLAEMLAGAALEKGEKTV